MVYLLKMAKNFICVQLNLRYYKGNIDIDIV